MDHTIPYWILLLINIIIISLLWWLSKKSIFLLMLWWWVLLVLLQFLYRSFWKGIHLNLLIFNIDLQINNFIQIVREYSDSNGFRIGNIWFFSVIFSFILPAFLEEFGKFYVLKIINKKLQIITSIVLTIITISYVAIGFALIESIAYIFYSEESFQELLKISILRGLISTSSHILFSVIIWYYYGKALFLKFEIIDNLEITKTTKILKRFKKIPFINISSISKYYYIKYMFTGFLISVSLHAIYNVFWEYSLPIYAIITIVIWMVIFLKLVFVKKHNKNYVDLRNKIQYLKEMKDLRDKIKGRCEKL